MVKFIIGFLWIISFLSNLSANQIDRVVVYSEANVEYNQSKNIVVITEDDMAKQKSKTLIDVLSKVPGLSVTSYGKYQNASVYIKGASPHSTIVLLNGVKLQDAASGAFDIGQIPLLAVEKIEIIANGDGVLYGSNASGGVINIITKKANESKHFSGDVEYGSNNSSYIDFNYLSKYNDNKGSLNVFVSSNKSQGYSYGSINQQNDSNNLENDNFFKDSFLINYNYGNLDVLFSYNESSVDTDPFVYDIKNHKPYLLDAGDFVDEKKHYNGYIKYVDTYFGTANSFVLSMYSTNKKEDTVSAIPFVFGQVLKNTNNYDGNVVNFTYSLDSNYLTSGYIKLLMDYDYYTIAQTNYSYKQIPSCTLPDLSSCIWEKDDVKKSKYWDQYYGISSIVGYRFFDSWNINGGIRLSDNSKYKNKNKINYNISTDYIFLGDYKLRANYTSNFKAPNLFERYDNNFGNENLKEEQTRGFDFGIDMGFFNQISSISVTYFNQYIDDLIILDYSSGQKFINMSSKVHAQGVIFYNTNNINDYIDLSFGYYYLKLDEIIARRPKHTFSTDISLKPLQSLIFDIQYLYVGKSYDGFEATGFEKLNSYGLLNAKIQYDITNKFSTYIRGDNLLNTKYNPAYGFNSQGLGVFVGFIWK